MVGKSIFPRRRRRVEPIVPIPGGIIPRKRRLPVVPLPGGIEEKTKKRKIRRK